VGPAAGCRHAGLGLKHASRPAWAAGLLAGGLAALALGWATRLGLRFSAPNPHAVGPPPALLGDAEPVAIPSPSGTVLAGWLLTDGTEPAAVLLAHGIRANRLMLVHRAQALREAGYAVLLFDFRGHGESPIGRGRITFGRHEALDAEAALGLLRNRLPQARLGAVGISLGGAALLLGDAPLAIDALVLESVYSDIVPALANRLKRLLGARRSRLLLPMLVPLFRLLMRVVLRVPSRALRPIERMGALRAPVLVLGGADDPFTPEAETRALFARAGGPKHIVLLPGAGHVDLESHDREGWRNAVLPFLAEHLHPASAPVASSAAGPHA